MSSLLDPDPASRPEEEKDDIYKLLSEEDKEEYDKLAEMKHKFQRLIPEGPYITTLKPLDNPYHRESEQAVNSWLADLGTLWQPHEERKQYMSWIWKDRNTTLLEQRTAVDERREAEAKKAALQGKIGNKMEAPNTPAPTAFQAPVKKMKFGDYKNSKANGTLGTPRSITSSPDMPPVSFQQAHKHPTNGIPSKPVEGGQKRPREDPLDRASEAFLKGVAEYHAHQRALKAGAPPAKKLKPTTPLPTEKPKAPSPPCAEEPKASSDIAPVSNSTPHGLPPLLSPTSIAPPWGLPRLLSPTLPPVVQAEMKRIEARERAASNASSSSDAKSQKLSVPVQDGKLATHSPKGIAQKSMSNGIEKSPHLKLEHASTPSRNASRDSPKVAADEKPKFIVKLKYPKRSARPIQQILRLPAKRSLAERQERVTSSKEKSRPSQGEDTKQLAPVKPTKIKPSTSTSAITSASTNTTITTPLTKPAKRPHPVEDSASVPAKRVKVPTALNTDKRPSTPSDQAIPSPALTNPLSSQKTHSQFATPRKDLRALNMVRNASSPGNDSTPGGPVLTPNTTKAPATGGSQGAHLSTEDKKRSGPEADEWNAYHLRTQILARDLKHKARDLEERLPDLPEHEKRAAQDKLAAMCIETVMCFMISFHASDAANPYRNIEQTWRSLLNLAKTYKRQVQHNQSLDAIRLTLVSVIACRVAFGPRNSNFLNLASATAAFRTLHADAQVAAHAISVADAVLGIGNFQRIFPKTWNGRELKESAPIFTVPQRDFGTLNDLNGPYWLPLNGASTPIVGVRFGVKVLEEWAGRHPSVHEFIIGRVLDGSFPDEAVVSESTDATVAQMLQQSLVV